MANILIIDDDDHITDILSSRFETLGHTAIAVSKLKHGISLIKKEKFDIVFLDVNLPDGDGLEALPDIRQLDNELLVIIITAFGNTSGAKLALENGAWDYLEKPFYKEKLQLQLNRALEYQKEKQKHQEKILFSPKGVIGRSSRFLKCIEQAASCTSSQANVLLEGESGTGKELFAKIIHENSPSNKGNFIVVDCAALPETLMESVLFGHRKGAFTGADKKSEGLISMANHGTLFLDEVGELPLSAQKVFLRVLQERKYRPIGSSDELKSRFRLISATNRNLKAMVEEGTFRNDLYHRIQTFYIKIPALRDRKKDIKELSLHYIDKLCAKYDLPSKALLPETVELLENYDWPGNVRELINVLEHAVVTDPNLALIYPMQLPTRIRLQAFDDTSHQDSGTIGEKPDPENEQAGLPAAVQPLADFKEFRSTAMDRVESDYFQTLLATTDWDLDTAAEHAGLSKNRIYFYIRKFDLKPG